MDVGEKMQKCNEYVEALEVEKKKIQVFQRELPLCLELVSQAIDACRQQLSATNEYIHGRNQSQQQQQQQQQSEWSEQTSSHGPVLEFIPIKRASSACSNEDMDEEDGNESSEKSIDKAGKKSDWLRSVQLWNQSPDPAPVTEVKKVVRAFKPFTNEKVVEVMEQRPENKPASSTSETVTVKCRKEESVKEKETNAQRKQRRCWSPELHRRFIHALQQLGGPHVATPKQIKELMKVDGLTNDEVKSHLQKYRLHMRRPSTTIPSNGSPQDPQFVVVGGIWVPAPEYASAAHVAATATTSSGDHTEANNRNGPRTPSNGVVYAPVASVGPPFPRSASNTQKQNVHSESHSEDTRSNGKHRGARAHSSPPASSSSTHTTATATTSPMSS